MSEAAVRIQEVDLSSRVASFAGVFGGIVVQAKRGDSQRPTLVVSNRQYLDRYTAKGKVEVGEDLAHYSALAYLARSDKLWVQRAINGALFGGAVIKRSDAPSANRPLQEGFSTPDSYVFDSQMITGKSEITKVIAPANLALAAVPAQFSVQTVADNFKSLAGKYFILPDSESTSVAVWFKVGTDGVEPTHSATRAIEVAINENDSVNVVANKVASALSADSAFSATASIGVVTVVLAQAGLAGNHNEGDAGCTITLDVVGAVDNFTLNGSGFVLNDQGGSVAVWFNITGIPAPAFVTSAVRAIEITSITGVASTIAVAGAIRDAIQLDASFSAVAMNSEVTITCTEAGVRDQAVAHGLSVTRVQAGEDSAESVDESLLIYGSSEGAFINDIGYRLTTHLDDPDLVAEEGAFLLEIFRRGLEGTPVEKFMCSRIIGKQDGYGRNMFVEDVLKASAFIRAVNNDLVDEEIYPKSQYTIQWLGAGDDGLTPTVSTMITAASKFANADEVPVTILMDGGYATPAYGAALDTIAKTRMDCVAILSTPYAAEVSADYLNEIADYRKTKLNLNSSFSSLYTPHVLIQDTFNDREIYVAPDGFVAGSISFNANSREIWYPPAGYRRGVIDVRGVSRVLDSGERSFLYNIGVNPIKSTAGRGIVIWGQKTLLSRPSLLDRLNVRLLLIVISPAMKEFLEDYLFEINDRVTRSEVQEKISDYLRDIQSRRGIVRFQVICDESNNTSQVIDNQQMIVDVLITPSGSVEDIPLRVVIVNNSTSFSDAAQAV